MYDFVFGYGDVLNMSGISVRVVSRGKENGASSSGRGRAAGKTSDWRSVKDWKRLRSNLKDVTHFNNLPKELARLGIEDS